MTKYRHDLPQLRGGTFLTDGGMETTLIFHEGLDLPHFASLVLLETEEGRRQLVRYYEKYLGIARRHGLGFILDSVTWRGSPDWGAALGYSRDKLRAANHAAIALIEELRALWETPGRPIVLNGVIGPRGDGYKAGNMDAAEAADYHAFQIGVLKETAADMVSAITMNSVGEAAGVALAARQAGMPCVISFTVETDGKLARGETLRHAIETVDVLSGGHPLYFMVNCAHPTHFEDALSAGESWLERVRGIRANASVKSHQELDESTELDAGDPVDLARRYRGLARALPHLSVLGGCCGTDHRHIAAICEACVDPATAAA